MTSGKLESLKFNHKAENAGREWESYSMTLRTYVKNELSATVIASKSSLASYLKPEHLGFQWLFLHPDAASSDPSYPDLKELPPRKKLAVGGFCPLRDKRRKKYRAFNRAVCILHNAAQDKVYGALQIGFVQEHPAIFRQFDPHTGEGVDTDEGRHLHGNGVYNFLDEYYRRRNEIGLIGSLLELVKVENNFSGDWHVYSNSVTQAWQNLQAARVDDPEKLQVMKCLVGIINRCQKSNKQWKIWAEQYLSTFSQADSDDFTLRTFFAKGLHFSQTKDLSRLVGGAYEDASGRQARALMGRGDRQQQQKRGRGAPERGRRCSACNKWFIPVKRTHLMCKDCATKPNGLAKFVGSDSGAQRLQQRLDHKRRAKFARQNDRSGQGRAGNGRGDRRQQQQGNHGNQLQQQPHDRRCTSCNNLFSPQYSHHTQCQNCFRGAGAGQAQANIAQWTGWGQNQNANPGNAGTPQLSVVPLQQAQQLDLAHAQAQAQIANAQRQSLPLQSPAQAHLASNDLRLSLSQPRSFRVPRAHMARVDEVADASVSDFSSSALFAVDQIQQARAAGVSDEALHAAQARIGEYLSAVSMREGSGSELFELNGQLHAFSDASGTTGDNVLPQNGDDVDADDDFDGMPELEESTGLARAAHTRLVPTFEDVLHNLQFSIPSELPPAIPEFWPIGDSGATHHIIPNAIFLAHAQATGQRVIWGDGSSSPALAVGFLFGTTLVLDTGSSQARPLVFTTGQYDSLLVPSVERALLSFMVITQQLGLEVILGGQAPRIQLTVDTYIPLVLHDGYYLVPLYPPPAQSYFSQPDLLDSSPPSAPSVSAIMNLASIPSWGAATTTACSAEARVGDGIEKRTVYPLKPVEEDSDRDEIESDSDISFEDEDEDKEASASRKKAKQGRGAPRGRMKLSVKHNIRQQLMRAHRKYGHIDPRKLITGKKLGRFHSSEIPSRGRNLWKKSDCPVCLAMQWKRPARPLRREGDLVNDGNFTPWDRVMVDLSGKFRVKSFQNNRYYALFTCLLTRVRKYFGLKKRSHFTIIFLKFVARVGKWPKALVSDRAGEILKHTLRNTLAARGVDVVTVPRGEHHLTGFIEADVGHLDNAVKTVMVDANLPPAAWEAVGEHMSMLQDCVRPSPLDGTVSCFEAAFGEIPDLDLIPPPGCLAVQNLADKKTRHDFKLSPANRCGVFLGVGHLDDTHGFIILHEKTLVVGRDNVTFLQSYMPLVEKDSRFPEWKALQKLLGRHGSTPDAADEVTVQLGPQLNVPETFVDVDDSDEYDIDEEVQQVLRDMPTCGSQPNAEPSRALDDFSDDSDEESRQRPQRETRLDQEFDKIMEAIRNEELSVDDYDSKQAEMIASRHASSSARVRRSQRRQACRAQGMTEQELRRDKAQVVGSEIEIEDDFDEVHRGRIAAYDGADNMYHVDFDDGTHIDLPFDDFLLSLPYSKIAYAKEENDMLFGFSQSASAFKASLTRPPKAAGIQPDDEVVTEPRTHAELLNAPDKAAWVLATDDEYYKLERKGCWVKVKRSEVPEGARIIRSKWVFKVKMKDGKFERRKARIVACGYDQRPGIDYASAFSPTASQVALRLILGLTSFPGFFSEDYDAESAFISALLPPDEITYMEPLPGYDIGDDYCLKLVRSLYGLCASSRHFFLLAREVYTEKAGLRQLQSDQCVFVRFVSNVKGSNIDLSNDELLANGYFRQMPFIPPEERRYPSCPHSVAAIIVVTYVDNSGIRSNCRELVDDFVKAVKKDGRIVLLQEGNLTWFLGVRYQYDPVTGAVKADQEAYIDMLLARHGMRNAHSNVVPLDKKFDIYSLPVATESNRQLLAAYASLVGELQYIACNTAPEISKSLHLLSKFMTRASIHHLNACKQVLRYLIGHKDRAIVWCARTVPAPHSPFELYGYCDASWADNKQDRKSSIFHVIMINGGAFAWRATTSSVPATSTAEAELYALAAAVMEVIWARNLAFDLHFAQLAPTILYEDNHACIKMTHRELSRSRTKHIHNKYSFVHHHHAHGTFEAKPIPGLQQIADIGATLRDATRHEACTKVMRGEIGAASL